MLAGWARFSTSGSPIRPCADNCYAETFNILLLRLINHSICIWNSQYYQKSRIISGDSNYVCYYFLYLVKVRVNGVETRFELLDVEHDNFNSTIMLSSPRVQSISRRIASHIERLWKAQSFIIHNTLMIITTILALFKRFVLTILSGRKGNFVQ